MREFERIDRICELLKTAWKTSPDWRLGQLMVNYFGVDPFYVEDTIIERKLEQIINNQDENNK